MKYNFDEVVNRYNTYCYKYDYLRITSPDSYKEILPLFIADMDFKTAQPILDAMHKVVDFGMFGYTSNNCEPEYNKAVIRWFREHHNLEINDEEIIYSDGTIEAVNAIIKTFSNVGDGIIVCRPIYGHFNQCIEDDCYRKVVDCHLIKNDKNEYVMNYADIEEKCSDGNNRIFILSSPQNPTGRVWRLDELKKLAEICKKHNVLLVSDEVHCDILRKGVVHHPIYEAVDDTSNVIMLTAINKTFNLAGLQCSNVIIKDKSLRDRFTKGFGMHAPTPFAIAALIAAYNEGDEWLEQVNEYIDGNIDYVIDFCKQNMPWIKVDRPEGTYCLWLDFSASGLSSEEIHRRIYDEALVKLQDGIVHDPEFGQQCQRICVPTSRTILKEAMERIAKVFK